MVVVQYVRVGRYNSWRYETPLRYVFIKTLFLHLGDGGVRAVARVEMLHERRHHERVRMLARSLVPVEFFEEPLEPLCVLVAALPVINGGVNKV